MLHDTTDEIISFLTQTVRIGCILEYIFPILLQGHIDVHAGTVDAELRLRHKCCVQTVASCDGTHRHLERHDIVRSM